MSFGFGSNNNNTSTGFGGFGSGSGSGFGANNNNSSSTPSLFGANNNNTTTGSTGGFGGGGGFGSTNTSSPFGTKPSGFGTPAATSGGNLFGGNTSTSGGFGSGGGFGANNTNTASSGFGASNTGGGIFGANKPAASTGFGSTNTGSIFGGGGASTTGGGFGSTNNNTTGGGMFGSNSNNTSTGFGATNTNTSGGFGGFGSSTPAASNNGTAGPPFQATTEKDGTSNQTSSYQSITMQQPYQGKSFEELRVEDYMQGRRYGNTNGQAGSFGQSTGFGGSAFGNNQTQNTSSTPSLFGGNNQQQTGGSSFGGFGNTQSTSNTTGGFGSTNSTGGGLFGGQKTLGGFGANPTSNTTTGGFGNSTSGSTGGLFGGTANNTSNTGGGLFGGNNQQQNKPAFGGFGSTNNNTPSSFGNTGTGGGGLFGNNTNTNTNTTGGLFGQNQNQQQSGNAFGGNASTGGGLFGGAQAQSKPAGGLFGGSTTNNNAGGGGLFGSNQNQTQQSGGLFGSTPQNNNAGGGLFGGTQNKPATSSLFGGSTANTSTGGGGLFGGNQDQQQQSGGLFGGSQNNAGGNSLFGGSQNKPQGSSLFGGNNNTSNTGGGSLFGGSLGQNNQNQQNNAGSSLFGSLGQNNQSQSQNNNSMFGSNFGQSQNQTPQNNQLHASLTMSPYGNDQLFGSLQQTSTPVGPLATPLNGARAAASKTPSLLSSTRLNSPIYTPRASTMNRNGTYGLSYSTYGTPGSAFSTSLTPAQSSLLKPSGSLGSALSSRLAKSMSMNNLRGDGTPQGDSLLRPVPGSASSKYLQSGSMRKLTIDRSLRMDLFAPPEEQTPGAERKNSTVRFTEPENSPPPTASPSENNALVRTEEPEEEEESSPALLRSQPKAKAQSNGAPEMQQVNGSSLSTVQEDDETRRTKSAPATNQPSEKVPKKSAGVGDYWTKPPMKDLRNMSRKQLEKVGNFVVGREGVGYIEFGNVDLSKTELEDICGNICIFKQRSVTVYPDEKTKPPVGQGLNVPSTIHLEHSYPKNLGTRKAVMAGSGPAYDKHVMNLRKTRGTNFKSYDAQTGVWTFTVEHYTTYEVEDDETEDMDIQHETSALSEPPEDETMQSLESANGTGEVDDTFEFKIQSRRSQQSNASAAPGPHVPGGFGGFDAPDESRFVTKYDPEEMITDGFDDDTMMSGGLGLNKQEDPFTSPGGAVQAPSPGAYERYHSSMALDEDTGAVEIAEETQDEPEPEPELPGSFIEEPKLLRSILKPTPGFSTFASPQKLATDSWEDQLQRTMSPKKRDRQALRDRQQSVLREEPEEVIESPFKRSMLGQSTLNQSHLAQKSAKKVGFGGSTMKASTDGLGKSQAFRTSMDIMNSLWAQEKTTKKAPSAARGFENPYPKRQRLSASAELSEQDANFHNAMKPSFSSNGILVYSVPGSVQEVTEPLARALEPLVGEHKEVRFARFAPPDDINTLTLSVQKGITVIGKVDGFRQANARSDISFQDIKNSTEGPRESAIWGVAGVLFDPVTVACTHLMHGMSPDDTIKYEPRLRQDAFGELWAGHLSAVADEQLALKKTAEEKALLLLTLNKVRQAAEILTEARDFKLATMVAQLPGTHDSRDLMQKQIKAWVERNDWSEMSEPVRALYSIIAGEVCAVTGKNGPAEDRASSFCISERFGLNWMQSFGLRLYYGGYLSLDDAVKAYSNDLADGREKVLPTPGWQDVDTNDGREDTLLGLLRMYVGRPDAEALFDSKTVSGDSTNSRIAWQLATIFASRDDGAQLSDEKLDQLTLDFAAQLESANSFLSAVWVLLYVRNRSTREQAISAILYRNADKIPDFNPLEDTDGVFHLLHNDLQIPTDLIWRAKAQYARTVARNPGAQVLYLLNAGDTDQAHDVLCSTIGPQAVIEQEHEDLTNVLARFPDHKPQGWVSGGGVFEEYTKLWNLSTPRKHTREGREVMERLGLGLREMSSREGKMSVEEKVAVVEMERVLREEVRALHGSGEGLVVEGVGGEQVEEGKGMDAFVRYREAMGVVV
ncbi:hypothetical protein M409DRAFT_24204 [Zasmidium cellare ATCC 36951]|uniref:Peptidase S59 domain-containing protein n=1 Tax=Zasmidium cellare ATCC 36951 TaxID=1080233 RepID=A0A6A6CE22_ZASCE|nr:uncharacterized protein M409DRAFT_24204 [Zasmidium cellare ATCC 36951]KAF2165355.1 hypothetical protein M409DRAFT_24204 [Zasmidium cellare ATCC 36951]